MPRSKTCTKCRQTKSINQFYRNRTCPDEHNYHCKACEHAFKKSDIGRDAQDKYRKSDKGKRKDKRYDQSKKRRLAKKRFRQSDKGRQVDKRYKKSEKGQQAKKKGKAIRRTNQTQAGGSYTTNEWCNLCKFYDFHCLRCNEQFPLKDLTLDHIKPVSKGGSSFIWNLQPLCQGCNSSKNNKQIDYRKTLPNWLFHNGLVWQQDTLF